MREQEVPSLWCPEPARLMDAATTYRGAMADTSRMTRPRLAALTARLRRAAEVSSLEAIVIPR